VLNREQFRHARRRQVRVVQDAGLVGEAKQFGQMQDGARAFLAADHDEMILQAVEPCKEHDAGFVKRRRLEDVARERQLLARECRKALQIAMADGECVEQPARSRQNAQQARLEWPSSSPIRRVMIEVVAVCMRTPPAERRHGDFLLFDKAKS
jgi:hypothetical protein